MTEQIFRGSKVLSFSFEEALIIQSELCQNVGGCLLASPHFGTCSSDYDRASLPLVQDPFPVQRIKNPLECLLVRAENGMEMDAIGHT